MYYERSAWLRLLGTLKDRTLDRRLQWQQSHLTEVAEFTRNLNVEPQVFTAKTGKSSYSLSAGDHFSRAPYELKVWEGRDQRRKPLAVVASSLDFAASPDALALNRALESLFEVVSNSVESEADIVSRLIDDLDSLEE